MERFDYIIVGAGSAGCILANRLTASGQYTVCLLEAGPPDWNPFIHIPAGFIKTLENPRINWMYQSESSHWTAGRMIEVPRGKTLGGSSSINGHIYNRGQRLDYDTWSQQGNRGWGYADVLPYFKRAEGNRDRRDPFHGNNGPFIAGQAKSNNPLYPVFLEACRQAGHPATDDFNGAEQEGVGRQDFNIEKGRRVCSATAYLAPVQGRTNLRVVTRAHATRLLFQGTRAVGVEYARGGRGGKRKEARATREVIVCGGAVN